MKNWTACAGTGVHVFLFLHARIGLLIEPGQETEKLITLPLDKELLYWAKIAVDVFVVIQAFLSLRNCLNRSGSKYNSNANWSNNRQQYPSRR